MRIRLPNFFGSGLLTGMTVTLKTLFTKPVTVNYPLEKETPVPRARGVIALEQDACTVCIEGHKEEQPPSKPGGRVKKRATLDRFDIDYALCMYCGICVEVCPFDALFWTPEYEYSEYKMGAMMHDMDRLQDWMETVPEPPGLEAN